MIFSERGSLRQTDYSNTRIHVNEFHKALVTCLSMKPFPFLVQVVRVDLEGQKSKSHKTPWFDDGHIVGSANAAPRYIRAGAPANVWRTVLYFSANYIN